MQTVRNLLCHLRRKLSHLCQALDGDDLVFFAQVLFNTSDARFGSRCARTKRDGLRDVPSPAVCPIVRRVCALQLGKFPCAASANVERASTDYRRALCRRPRPKAGLRSPRPPCTMKFCVSSSCQNSFEDLGRKLRCNSSQVASSSVSLSTSDSGRSRRISLARSSPTATRSTAALRTPLIFREMRGRDPPNSLPCSDKVPIPPLHRSSGCSCLDRAQPG